MPPPCLPACPALLADGSHHAPLRNLCALVAANSMLGDAGLHRRSAARSCSCARHVACCMSSVCARAVNYKQKSLDIFASHRFVFISRCRLHYDLCKIVNTSDGSNSNRNRNNNGNKRAPNSLKPLFPFYFSCCSCFFSSSFAPGLNLEGNSKKGLRRQRLQVKCCLLPAAAPRPPSTLPNFHLSPIANHKNQDHSPIDGGTTCGGARLPDANSSRGSAINQRTPRKSA